MIHSYLLTTISVVFGIIILVLLSQKLKIAYPIFLVIAGLIISLLPETPTIKIDPDLIFLIFLPPILFEASWFTSWNEFRAYRKQIFSFAFGLVFLSSLIIAYFSFYYIAGATLAIGFLIGGIISPPDAVAATSVIKNLKIPKKVTTILEGESLINDAASLIIFKFALAAIVTSSFVIQDAILDFFLMAIGGIVVGLSIGYISGYLLKKTPPNTNVDTVFTILVPYIVYILAEYFEFSGVLAVVASGLMMSYNISYLTHSSRIQATNVWSIIIFLINAFIFLLIGLELPNIISSLSTHSLYLGIKYGALLSLVLLVIRIIYCFISIYAPWYFSKNRRKEEPAPSWKDTLVIGFAAMRGVVSLAAALSLPTVIANGAPFPHRDFILYVTFVTIIITLVIQGLLLPLILKLLHYGDTSPNLTVEKQELQIKKYLMSDSLNLINKRLSEGNDEVNFMLFYKRKLENNLDYLEHEEQWTLSPKSFMRYKNDNTKIALFIIHKQRHLLHELKKEKIYDEEIIRKISLQLDYNEMEITGFK